MSIRYLIPAEVRKIFAFLGSILKARQVIDYINEHHLFEDDSHQSQSDAKGSVSSGTSLS